MGEDTIYGDLKISYSCPKTGKRHTRSISYQSENGDRSGATWAVYYVDCPCGETHKVEV